MKCLVIGGGRFLGHKLLQELVDARHTVALFDGNPPPANIATRIFHIMGGKDSIGMYREEFADFAPDVVVHLGTRTREDVEQFIEAFRDVAKHLVVTSNTNIYLAQGRIRGTEPGPIVDTPITEESKLREQPLKDPDMEDKLEVEKAIRKASAPVTILRLPPLYGPHDYLRRFYPLMLRMIDERPFILLGNAQADWRWTHAFVDDAAHAIALAMAHPHSKGTRVYNVGELKTPTVKGRIEHIAAVMGWEGHVGVVPETMLPDYLKVPGDFAQDLLIDSSLIRKDLDYKEKGDYYDGLAASIEWYRNNPPPKLAGQTFNYSAEDKLRSVAFKNAEL